MVTTNEPTETMTTTPVNTPNDWDGGAYLACFSANVPWQGLQLTFTLSIIPSRRHKISGPHKSQSLYSSMSKDTNVKMDKVLP